MPVGMHPVNPGTRHRCSCNVSNKLQNAFMQHHRVQHELVIKVLCPPRDAKTMRQQHFTYVPGHPIMAIALNFPLWSEKADVINHAKLYIRYNSSEVLKFSHFGICHFSYRISCGPVTKGPALPCYTVVERIQYKIRCSTVKLSEIDSLSLKTL